MKTFSVIMMILSILTGFATISMTVKYPFTDDINLSCMSQEIIYIDETFEVEALAVPYNSVDNHIEWSISNEDIVTLQDTVYGHTYKATITPKAIGTVTITATTRNGIAKSFELKVIARPVTNVTLATNCVYSIILTGSEYTLTATVTPSNATFKALTWTSTNDSVLSVDQSGNFRAEGEGTATITATAHNGKSASKTFIVKDEIPVESITITNTGALSLNDSRTLTYKVTPANASIIDVTWSSSNEDIISITQEGVITALAIGSSTITVTNVNGKSYSATITVPRVAAQTFRINTPDTLGLNIGDTLQLSCYTYPSKVTDPITWKSSNADLISVDKNGLVTAHAYATSGVVITATCGDKTDTIIIFCASIY